MESRISKRGAFAVQVARFVIMALGLVICGVILAIIGGVIGGRVFGGEGLEAIGLAFIGIVAGYLLGNILGIILMKKIINRGGSIGMGIFGSIIGAIFTVAVIFLMNPSVTIFFWVLIISIPVLTLAGFHVKRENM